MKVFISQPMNGLTEEEIKKQRSEVEAWCKEQGYEVADSYCEECPSYEEGLIPLVYLSKAIAVLATCDAILLAPGWRKARGCRIEAKCAREYGLSRIHFRNNHGTIVGEDK